MPSVAVIGLGAVGSMLFREFASRGWHTVGYERRTVGSEDTAAGGPSRLFRTLYGEGPEYVPLILRSRQLWSELESTARSQLFFGGGSLTIASRSQVGWIEKMLQSAKAYDLPVAQYDPKELVARYPEIIVSDDEVGLMDPLGGIVLTKQSMSAAVEDGLRLGGIVRENTTVTGIHETGAGVTVTTADGSEIFDRVIVAAGARSEFLSDEISLTTYRVTASHHVPLEPRFSPYAFPPVMWLPKEGETSHGSQPLPGGQLVKFFSGAPERVEGVPEGGTKLSAEQIDKIMIELPKKLRGVRATPVEGASYYDGVTEDGHGLVGRSASSDRIVLCTGLSLHGFKLAPGLAEYVAKTVANEEEFDTYPFLRPDRF